MTRDQLLSALIERLGCFLETGEADAVLDEYATAQARRLAQIAASADADGRLDIASHAVLALLHWYRFQTLPVGDDLADLTAAIPHFRAISTAAAESIPEPLRRALASVRSTLAGLMLHGPDKAIEYLSEFEQSGDVEVLNAGIGLLSPLAVLYRPGDPGHAEVLTNLGTALLCRFEYALDRGDLDAAITAIRQAADNTPVNYPGRPKILATLGMALETRFEATYQLSDLDAAIDLDAEAARGFPPEEAIDRAGTLNNLSIALRMRFKHGRRQRSDLDAAITAAHQGLDSVPTDYPGRARLLSTLGNALLDHFELTADQTDLDAGIAASQQAVDATPATHPDRSRFLMNLGNALRDRFEYAGEIADLDTAIGLYSEAADSAAPGGRGNCLHNLGAVLRMRFRRTTQRADLDAAVTVLQQAVDSIPDGHPHRADCLSNLGGALLDRFEQTEDQADLNAAIVASRQAVDATPGGHPARIKYLGSLGLALRARSQLTGQLADIDAAMAPRQQALAAAQADDPSRAGMLSDLAVVLLDRFERSGQLADLDTAVDLLGEAIDITRHPDPHRALHLSNLGNVLRTRWRSGGPERDLDTAIELLTEAVGTAPADDPNNGMYKSNLGTILLDRFARTHQQRDLDTAIELLTRAAESAVSGRHRRAVALSNLASGLRTRFERGGEPGDLDAAIRVLGEALDMTDPGHPDRAEMLANLADALQARFELGGEQHDLDVAIATSRQAVDATPDDHTRRAVRLSRLGQIFLSRFEKVGGRSNSDDLMESIKCFREAANNATASWDVRITAAWGWGRVAEQYVEPGLALEGYSAAVGLLPETVWHGAERSTQEEHLTRWSSLATDAAACAVTAGEPCRAVEMLEQGRSVLWTQALRLRSDLSRLHEQAPDLAARLEQVRSALDQPPTSTLNGELIDPSAEGSAATRAAQDRAVEDRRRLTRAWDDLVTQVRRLPGFRHFLAPVPFTELQAAAGGGPVVIVNVSRRACHALIVTAAEDPGVRVVPLPGTSRADIIAQANKLIEVLHRASDTRRPFLAREADRHSVFDVLAWLWQMIAEPVLDALGHTGAHRDGSVWPRIWWCPTGPADHAAVARRWPLSPHPGSARITRRHRARPRDLVLHDHFGQPPARPPSFHSGPHWAAAARGGHAQHTRPVTIGRRSRRTARRSQVLPAAVSGPSSGRRGRHPFGSSQRPGRLSLGALRLPRIPEPGRSLAQRLRPA